MVSGYKDRLCSVHCLSCSVSWFWNVPLCEAADDSDNDNDTGNIQGKCENETSRTQGTCATQTITKLNVCMSVMRIY